MAITPEQYLQGSRLGLSDQQRNMAALILSTFTARGYSPQVAMGAVANAYAESRLDPCAVAGFAPWSGCAHEPPAGSENSVGLFQLNSAGGGRGMSVTSRKNAASNIARIIEELQDAEREHGAVVTASATAQQAARAFCVYVERPASAARKAQERAGIVAQLFPQWAASATPPALAAGIVASVAAAGASGIGVGLALVVLGALAVGGALMR